MRRLRALPVMLVVLLGLLGLAAPASLAHARPQASYSTLVSQFICTTCHEPLELVNSPQAQSEKSFLNGLIQRGLSVKQIRATMVANYGVAVLGRPPASGFNLTVYVLPPAVLVFGIALLAFTLPKWRARSRRAADTPLEPAPPLDTPEAKRLDDDLARFI